jgi:hypothetical protein
MSIMPNCGEFYRSMKATRPPASEAGLATAASNQ